jgi:hypothetical protein
MALTMSSRVSSLACPPRFSTPRRADRPSFGPAVAKVAEQLGTPLMPWQRLVADVALEVDPASGRLVYREVVLTVPRQSGKTTLQLAVMVHRAQAFGGRQRITYTAQTRNEARQKWEDDHVAALDRSAFRSGYRVRKTNGNEAILWKNGSQHGITATTEKSGHGKTLDLGVIDEAFAQVDARVEQAMKPAMITRPQPQLWVVSTAGTLDSTYLRAKVDAGRERAVEGATDSVAYFEWSAPDDADPGDEATWWSCMPALGHTITPEAIAADFASMEGPEFERAYLNRWNTNKADPAIPLDAWAACEDSSSSFPGVPVVAFDVTPDRARASIAVAGLRADGLPHIEVAEVGAGTSWVVDWLSARVPRWNITTVVCDPAGPAGSLLAPLAAAGVKVTPVSTREHAQACGGFHDAVTEHRLRHLPDPVLLDALTGGCKRQLNDVWLWSRKSSTVDISPLVACTLAFGALVGATEPVSIGYYGMEDDGEP